MSDVVVRVEGGAGRITLNRPKALNALTHDMVRAIHARSTRWRDDPRVAFVMIDGAGDRAFCAGGDIAYLYEHGRSDPAIRGLLARRIPAQRRRSRTIRNPTSR